MLERQIPNSPEAEKGLLSSILHNAEEVFEYLQLQGFTENWFLNPLNINFYNGLHKMWRDRKQIDLLSVTDFFRRNAESYTIGDPHVFVSDVYGFVETPENYRQYVSILRECYAQRKGIDACAQAEEAIWTASSLQEVYNATTGVFDETRALCEEKLNFDWERDALWNFGDKMEQIFKGQLVPKYIPTHLPNLNKKVGGLMPGEEVVIIGLPSTGKSTLGLNFVREAVMQHGKTGAIFSIEMGYEQCMKRVLADTAGISLSAMRLGCQVTTDDMRKFMSGITQISKSKLSIYDMKNNDMTPDSIEGEIRRLKKNRGLDIVMVDYLQLIRTRSQKEKRRDEELSGVSAQFKQLAMELDLVVILIAAENKEGGVRGSQGVEFDADNIIRMQPAKNKDNRVVGTNAIFIDKWREGERGYPVKVRLQGEYSRIVEDEDVF